MNAHDSGVLQCAEVFFRQEAERHADLELRVIALDLTDPFAVFADLPPRGLPSARHERIAHDAGFRGAPGARFHLVVRKNRIDFDAGHFPVL